MVRILHSVCACALIIAAVHLQMWVIVTCSTVHHYVIIRSGLLLFGTSSLPACAPRVHFLSFSLSLLLLRLCEGGRRALLRGTPRRRSPVARSLWRKAAWLRRHGDPRGRRQLHGQGVFNLAVAPPTLESLYFHPYFAFSHQSISTVPELYYWYDSAPT